jgi:DNA-binding GntR family transcriptional regulator
VHKGAGHPTIAAAAAAELRRRILEGAIPAGHPLRQDALADELGISRIPLREALVQLEAEGLVRILPHRGALVAELSVEDVLEVFELRAVLEPRLLRLSAQRLTPADYEALKESLRQFDAALLSGDIARWGELNTDFHMRLYARANRPRTEALVATLLRESDRHTRLQLSYTNERARAEQEHADILAHCEAGRVEDACGLLHAHIENVGEKLAAVLDRRDAARAPDRMSGR